MNEIYIVGEQGPEHNSISSVHTTYDGALEAWNKLRLKLIEDAKSGMEYCKKDGRGTEMYEMMLKNLNCTDPKKIDNYPFETPYIEKRKVMI
jgi:hypothetical protein